ncbi:hypothetical protein CsSME_00045040 [Camellia sinensis var. sinensis]
MWQRSLISLSVLLASIWLSNAFPIFLMAISSCVSEFTAALKLEKEKKNEGGGGWGNGKPIQTQMNIKTHQTMP